MTDHRVRVNIDTMATPSSYSLLPYTTHELRRAVTDAADAGYDGIELVDHHLCGLEVLGGPSAVRRFADEVGVEIVAVGLGILSDPGDQLAAMLESTSAMGAGAVIWVPPIRGFADWSTMASQVRALVSAASDLGIAVWCHGPHAGTLIENPEEMTRLMAELPGTKLCFDTGHYGLFTADVAGGVERFSDSIVHLHLRGLRRPGSEALGDYLPDRTKWEILLRVGAEFTGPQESAMDLHPATAALVRAGYEGWWSVEPPQRSAGDRFADMRSSLDAVHELRAPVPS